VKAWLAVWAKGYLNYFFTFKHWEVRWSLQLRKEEIQSTYTDGARELPEIGIDDGSKTDGTEKGIGIIKVKY
jgi:hypothetical protein